MLCANCDKRDTCTELCGLAREYADQDWVDFNSKLLDLAPSFQSEYESIWDSVYTLPVDGLMDKTRVVAELHNAGYSIPEIMDITGRTNDSVKSTLKRIRAYQTDTKACNIERVILRKAS